MANKSPLKYWLESVNLFQYFQNFDDHSIVTKSQCQCLTEEQLISIGISTPNHRQRILNHLPSDEAWMEETSPKSPPPPSLPEKTKNVRHSFLYTDNDAIRLSDNEQSNVQSPKPAQRPVPRPRTTIPNSRPKPVPRKRSKPQLNDDAPNSNIDKDTNLPESNIATRVHLVDACIEETSTDTTSDNQINQDYNSKSEVEPSTFTNDISKSNLNEDLYQNTVVDELPKDRHESGEYINVDFDNKLITDNLPTDQPCVTDVLGNRDTTFENVLFDSELNVFKVKAELAPDGILAFKHGAIDFPRTDMTEQNDSTMALDGSDKHGSCRPRSPIKQVPSKHIAEDQEENDDACLYEAIWVDPRKESAKSNNRDSSLINFSPSKQKTDVKNPRMSQLMDSKYRESTSFDMPHPSFPPPPLPVDQMDDLIQDFDPLSESQLPTLPARPSPVPNKMSFEVYENVQLPYHTQSATLPSDQNMEPDVLSPDILGINQTSYHATIDPFQHVDPFAEVQLDYEDLSAAAVEEGPSICDNENSQSSQFGTVVSFSPTNKTPPVSEAIYQMADDTDFDPFGLIYVRQLPRSVSSTSSGSGHNLNMVPPPPMWYEQFPERNSVYSVARVHEHLDDFPLYENIGDLYENVGFLERSQSMDNMNDCANGIYVNGLQDDINDNSFNDSSWSSFSWFSSTEDCDSSSNGSLEDLLDRETDDPLDAGTMSPVELLPTTQLNARRRERSGYLYKQGGVKQNRGWRRRWVIFDGKTLRYYSSSKDQVSKRIVPLSCMQNVEMDIKGNPISRIISPSEFFPNNSKQFKFKLHCTNRVFLFATDNLDDCKMWSSTLMEAILTYKAPKGGEVPGGDMACPDLVDWIKLDKNRYKFRVVLKKHKLCYYQNEEDYNMASPLHEIDMKLSSVKEIDRTKLQLATHYCTFILHFESSSDASNWKMAIEEAITDALGDNSVLDQVKENIDNTKCADCGAKDANWASMNLSLVLCLKCAGIHRGFDHRLSKVRSLRMDTKVWNSSLIEMFKVIGNKNANKFWLARLPQGTSLSPGDPPEKRKLFIHKKYKERLYCDLHSEAANQKHLNVALLEAAQTDNVLLTMQILLSGADVLYASPDDPNSTAFDLAKEARQRIQMEFLLQNGGDKTQNFTPGSEEASLVASLRAAIQHQGILHKTGSNMKDFLKRWCVLEHGHLSYFVNEESKVEKDRIDNDAILCIQSTSSDKLHPFCFELSSRKNCRTYLFSAATLEEQQQWLTKIGQVFCPVLLIESLKSKTITLAGYAYMKTGFTSNWQRCWYVLENRKLYFTDKEQEERIEDSLDLRKVKSITKINQSMSSCEACLEQGYLFALSAPERTLYFQSELVKDTDRMFNVFEIAVKRGGDILDDQVLQPDECPVFVNTCVNYIEQNGLKMRGIYREAAQDSRVQGLLGEFKEDARAVVLKQEEHSVHEVCNALKRYLRRLKDPLFTSHLYKRWLQTAGDSDHNTKLQWYKYLLQQLPRINYLTLKCLACHLHKLSKHSDENLMTLDNISIAFGSTLMQAENLEGGATNAGMVGTKMQLEMKVITDIITYYEWLFDIQQTGGSKDLEDKLKDAEERLKMISARGSITQDDMMIWVFFLDPEGKSESVKVNKETRVSDVLSTLISKMKLNHRQWSLHEIVKGKLERLLHADVELWPLIHEWRNWSADYSAHVCLCLKSNEFKDKLKQAYDPSRALFAEVKYADKKKFNKMAFEFTQARLSYYKDLKNLGNPVCSWNIEDLSIYKGLDPKRAPPSGARWQFTFLNQGDRVGSKELPYFGRTVCCPSEQDLLMWISAMLKSQHSSWF